MYTNDNLHICYLIWQVFFFSPLLPHILHLFEECFFFASILLCNKVDLFPTQLVLHLKAFGFIWNLVYSFHNGLSSERWNGEAYELILAHVNIV